MSNGIDSLIDSNQVLPLFPTLVWKTQVLAESRDSVKSAVVARLKDMPAGPLQPAGDGPWTSNDNFHRCEGLEPLTNFVVTTAEGALEYLTIIHEGIHVSRCHAIVSSDGRAFPRRSSANSYLTAIYCVQGASRMRVDDPRPQAGLIAPIHRAPSPALDEQQTMNLDEGALLLAPAWLTFTIGPTEREGDTIHLLFELLFSAYAEKMSRPKWQGNFQFVS